METLHALGEHFIQDEVVALAFSTVNPEYLVRIFSPRTLTPNTYIKKYIGCLTLLSFKRAFFSIKHIVYYRERKKMDNETCFLLFFFELETRVCYNMINDPIHNIKL